MRPRLVVLLLAGLAALLLAGCPPGSPVPPSLAPLFPTATPTLVPTPTPTREDEVVIPFETIAVNELIETPLVGGEPEIVTSFWPSRSSWEEVEKLIDQGPAAFLLTAPEDVTPLQGWLPPETLTAIANVDFEQHAVVAFFAVRGGGSDGYIARIATSQDGLLTVYARLRSRGSGPDELTFPFHIVKLQRQDVPFPLSADTQVTLEINE